MQPVPEPTGEMAAYKRVMTILYLALLVSVPMYGIVAELVAANRERGEPGVVKTALLAVGAGTVAAVLFIRFSLIPPQLQRPELELAKRLTRLRGYYIVCFALSEAVALYGLVLRFAGGRLPDSLPFFIVALGMFAVCYPRMPQTMSSGPFG